MQLGQGSRLEGGGKQPGNPAAVVDPKFPHHARPWIAHGLVEHHGAIGVRHRPVEGARRDAQNVASGFEANNVIRVIPTQIDQIVLVNL